MQNNHWFNKDGEVENPQTLENDNLLGVRVRIHTPYLDTSAMEKPIKETEEGLQILYAEDKVTLMDSFTFCIMTVTI